MSVLKKPTIVVVGNCQARNLHRCLEESPELTERYRLVYVRNFRKGDQGVVREKDMARCAVLLEQVAHKAPELPIKENLPAGCQVIRFPILWLGSLWPMATADPRNRPTERHPTGPFPYGDKMVLRLVEQGMGPDEVAERYLAMDPRDEMDLDRYHEIVVAKLVDLDRRSEVKGGAFVLENFRAAQLLVTPNHPAEPLTRFMRDEVFARLGVAPPESDLMDAMASLDDFHLPIHPAVAEHFGLQWYDEALQFRYFDERFGVKDFIREFARPLEAVTV
jgi:hypothetical protein